MDLTNSDMLDCSPFAENYSYITTRSTTPPPSSTPKPRFVIGVKPVAKPVVGKYNPSFTPVVAPIGTPVVAPIIVPVAPLEVAPITTPTPTIPTPTSGGGGGGGGGSAERKTDGKDATQAGSVSGDSKEFYKSYWFWGLLIGGLGGYLLAKNKGKNLMAYGLVGAGIGGGAGFGIEKVMGKMKVTAPPTTSTEPQGNPEPTQ